MFLSFKSYWELVRKNPDVFAIGFLSTGFITVAILFHYLVNQNLSAVILLSIGFIATQCIAVFTFPTFVNTKTNSMEHIRWGNLILHCIRMLCLLVTLWLYPGDWLSGFLVVLSFFIAFDVFLVGLPKRLASILLITNAILVALLYSHLMAFIVFVVVAGAQTITYLVQIIFRRMIIQNKELIALNTKIDQISTEAERLRLKGDLHDTLGHELTALTLQVSMMQQAAQGDDAENLALLKSRIKGVNESLRGIIENRHTTDDMSLQEIVTQQVRRLPRLKVSTHFPEQPIILNLSVQRLVVSGVLELLTNCLKHGNPHEVSMTLSQDATHAILQIDNAISHTDNDTEFVSSSIGLNMLTKRLNNVNGELVTETKNNRFYASMRLPI